MTHHREPVDPDLLADTIRLYGTAIEYRGQVFNPAEVVVHTNGTTDARRVSLVWSVVNRWTRPDCAPTTDEAQQLLAEIREMLTATPTDAAPSYACPNAATGYHLSTCGLPTWEDDT